MRSTSCLKLWLAVLCVVMSCGIGHAQTTQTTSFTYQGKLTDGGGPANGPYDLQFRLFDALTDGSLQGSPNTVTKTGVQVTNGIFTVQLDFGAGAFPGANRFLEVSVRRSSSESFTPLTPRQPITSNPYAIRSANATAADVATNATQLGGFAANQYVRTTDARMTDARNPLPNSTNYIQSNPASTQSGSFNISGNGQIVTGTGDIRLGSPNGDGMEIRSSAFGPYFATAPYPANC